MIRKNQARKRVSTSKKTIRTKHNKRPVEDRIRDEKTTEQLTTDEKIWSENPDKYDVEGVDTAVPNSFRIIVNRGSRFKSPPFALAMKLPESDDQVEKLRTELRSWLDDLDDANEEELWELGNDYERYIQDEADTITDVLGSQEASDYLNAPMRGVNIPSEAGYIWVLNYIKPNQLFLEEFWTHPRFRGTGLGNAMMRELVNHADLKNKEVLLDAQPFEREAFLNEDELDEMRTPENVQKLVDFYKEYGFEPVGEIKTIQGELQQRMVRQPVNQNSTR